MFFYYKKEHTLQNSHVTPTLYLFIRDAFKKLESGKGRLILPYLYIRVQATIQKKKAKKKRTKNGAIIFERMDKVIVSPIDIETDKKRSKFRSQRGKGMIQTQNSIVILSFLIKL